MITPDSLSSLAAAIYADRVTSATPLSRDDADLWAALIGDTPELDAEDKSRVLVRDEQGAILGSVPISLVMDPADSQP